MQKEAVTKCPTDAVQKSPALHMMASCANTLQVGVNCSQCFPIMVFYDLHELLGQAMPFTNKVNNNKQQRNAKVIRLNL